MVRVPSLGEAVLLSIEKWDRTLRDRANQANECPYQPQLIPYEIHVEPHGLVLGVYYPVTGFRLAKVPNDGTSGP